MWRRRKLDENKKREDAADDDDAFKWKGKSKLWEASDSARLMLTPGQREKDWQHTMIHYSSPGLEDPFVIRGSCSFSCLTFFHLVRMPFTLMPFLLIVCQPRSPHIVLLSMACLMLID